MYSIFYSGNILIYQQLYIKKPYSILDNISSLCSTQHTLRGNDYFLTITGDGILKSHDHLLLAKI